MINIFLQQSQEGIVGQNTYRELARKESDLQKQVIKLSEENIELRFECEQAKKDVPRLKVRFYLRGYYVFTGVKISSYPQFEASPR